MKSRFARTMIVVGPVLLLIIIGGFLWQAGFLTPKAEKPGGPLEKISIGVSLTRLNGLIWIAQNQGFDKEQGLEFTLKSYQAGRYAIKDLTSGRLDLACCAEFVLVSEILAGQADLRCLSALASGEIEELIARRDRGINRPEDLRGKTIGVPRGTIADFFLGRFLTFNQIALREVTIVNVNPKGMADALAEGKVDAVMAWTPLIFEITKKMGNNVITWPAQGDQEHYWLLLAQEGVVKERPAALVKLLRSLTQAADYMKQHPEEARDIISRCLQVSLSDFSADRFPVTYELFLDQALLLAMEDQARWMIEHKLTGRKQVPDFLDYLDADILLKTDPKAVRLVLPGKGRPG